MHEFNPNSNKEGRVCKTPASMGRKRPGRRERAQIKKRAELLAVQLLAKFIGFREHIWCINKSGFMANVSSVVLDVLAQWVKFDIS